MSDIGTRVGSAAVSRLAGKTGVGAAVAALSAATGLQAQPFSVEQIRHSNIAAELVEKTGVARYPLLHVYCERVTNRLSEKFRRFSGEVRMVAELRVSQLHLEGIEHASQLLADAITEVLDNARGSWGNGMYFTGGYEVVFGPVKPGGKNFVQSTKVSFDVEVSSD